TPGPPSGGGPVGAGGLTPSGGRTSTIAEGERIAGWGRFAGRTLILVSAVRGGGLRLRQGGAERAPKLSDAVTEASRQLGKALRAHHQEHDHAEDQEVDRRWIEHALSLSSGLERTASVVGRSAWRRPLCPPRQRVVHQRQRGGAADEADGADSDPAREL